MNGKSVGIAAGCGFALSFLTGIISGNAFLIILVRAFIFAIVFAALAAGFSFLYSKFLTDDSGSLSSEGVSASKAPKMGGNVDIVIQDEKIDDDESGPKFYVEDNRKGLNTESPQHETTVSPPENTVNGNGEQEVEHKVELTGAEEVEETPARPEFVPSAFEQAEKVPAGEAVNQSVPGDVPENKADGSNKVNSYSDGSNIENLDSLPEIGDLSEDKSSDSGDIIDDSDFATAGSSSSSKGATFADGQEASAANADVMAQAIRTLLAKEN